MASNTADVQARREELTRDFARRFGVVLVLKGHRTLVQFGDEAYANATGNPGMATGGTGDVLTGVIAALIGQRLRPFDAAVLGVYLHGLAGDLARDDFGEVSLTAADLLDYLPQALLRHALPKGPPDARDLPALPTTGNPS
jgi:NAD(P)H-hydrate epimerase